MERTWIKESSFNIEKRVWWFWGRGGGLKFCVCMFGEELWKIGEVKWEGVNQSIELRAWLHEPGLLALQRSRHLSKTQQKSTLRFHDNRASPVSWDPSIVMPGEWTKRLRNRTAGNTLLMRIASNLYIKMAALGRLFSCNNGRVLNRFLSRRWSLIK